jgi:hypothetical protein
VIANKHNRGTIVLGLGLLALCSCRKAAEPTVEAAVPKGFVDRTFHSRALGRDVTYRVFPAGSLAMDRPVHVLYLLHGNGNSYRDWLRKTVVCFRKRCPRLRIETWGTHLFAAPTHPHWWLDRLWLVGGDALWYRETREHIGAFAWDIRSALFAWRIR